MNLHWLLRAEVPIHHVVLRKQGKRLGKGGIEIQPSDERSAPVPPPGYEDSPAEGRHRVINKRDIKAKERAGNPTWRTKEESDAVAAGHNGEPLELLPRETGHDIGMGSPVPLSLEAVGVITRMRNQKVINSLRLGTESNLCDDLG